MKNGLFVSALGFGLITLFLNGGLQLLLPSVFKTFYNDEKWTLGKNIFVASITILLVSLGNFLWAFYMNFTSMSFVGLFTFLGYTVAVGIIPTSFIMLIEQSRLTKKYEEESTVLNEHLVHELTKNESTSIVFRNEEGKVHLRIKEDEFLFCKSADNYIELFYVEGDDIKKELFRNSLKNIESDFSGSNNLMRVHRSYLVNIRKVKSVDGNARGLKLKLEDTLPEVPISRPKHDEVLALLDSH